MPSILDSLDWEGAALCTHRSLSRWFEIPSVPCLSCSSFQGLPNVAPFAQPSLLHCNLQTADCYQCFESVPCYHITWTSVYLSLSSSFLDLIFLLRSHKFINIQIWKEENAGYKKMQIQGQTQTVSMWSRRTNLNFLCLFITTGEHNVNFSRLFCYIRYEKKM